MSVLLIFAVNPKILLAQEADQLQLKLGQKVTSMEFRDTNIKDVLRLLARQHGLNIVVSSEVTGEVSVSLYNVEVRDVLRTILESLGCHFIIKNDLILVKSFQRESFGETSSEVFHLNYLDAIELKETLLPVLTKKGEMKVLDLVKTEKQDQRRSDVLLVKDLPENLVHIRAIISELDIAQNQLLIEARLIETIIGKDEKFGLDMPKEVKVKMTGSDPVNPGSVDLEGGLAATSELPLRSSAVKLGILTLDELALSLNMLAQDEDTKLVSNPKVATLNNKKAVIRIGTVIPIPEVSRGIGGDLITYKDKRVDVVLEVIPKIEPGNKINLTVHATIEEIIGYTGTGDISQPITSIREVQTVVSVTQGETVVLGGMVRDNKIEVESKVWLLGDIPFLGALFTSTTNEINKSDLLIFITPQILADGSVILKK